MIAPTHIPFPESAGPGEVYRSPMPRANQLQKLRDTYKIHTIVQLCFDEEFERYGNSKVPRLYHELQYNVIKFPIKDFSVPESKRETVETVNKILALLSEGNNVLIHCVGGKGRTGLMLACMARKVYDYTGPEAVSWIRQYFHAVETRQQEEFVATFLEEGKPAEQEESLGDEPSECSTSSTSSFDRSAQEPVAYDPDQHGRQAPESPRQPSQSGDSVSSEDTGHIAIQIGPTEAEKQDESEQADNDKGCMQCCTIQ